MKLLSLLLLCLLSFNGFGQYKYIDEDDTLEYYEEYTQLDHKDWSIKQFYPDSEDTEWDTLTWVRYNPYINNDILDSILNWRESKGYKPIEVKWADQDRRMIEAMVWVGMDISKEEKSKITLSRFEDEYPDCDCSNSISDNILDDSLLFSKNKAFKDYFLTDNIKRIEIYYYQVRRETNRDAREEHLIVKIKRRFRLFTVEYWIF